MAHLTGNCADCAVHAPNRLFLAAPGDATTASRTVRIRLIRRQFHPETFTSREASDQRALKTLLCSGRTRHAIRARVPCRGKGASGPKRPAPRSLLVQRLIRTIPDRGRCHSPPGLPRMSISPGRGPPPKPKAQRLWRNWAVRVRLRA